jgi:hypothetical protein
MMLPTPDETRGNITWGFLQLPASPTATAVAIITANGTMHFSMAPLKIQEVRLLHGPRAHPMREFSTEIEKIPCGGGRCSYHMVKPCRNAFP